MVRPRAEEMLEYLRAWGDGAGGARSGREAPAAVPGQRS